MSDKLRDRVHRSPPLNPHWGLLWPTVEARELEYDCPQPQSLEKKEHHSYSIFSVSIWELEGFGVWEVAGSARSEAAPRHKGETFERWRHKILLGGSSDLVTTWSAARSRPWKGRALRAS